MVTSSNILPSSPIHVSKIPPVKNGYTLLVLLFAIFVLTLGLMIAVPVWETQIQRQKEEELIFRGRQYVEAIRIFQMKNPGRFPRRLDELIEEKCIRRLYPDPMTMHGQWNVILLYSDAAAQRERSSQKVLVSPQTALPSITNPQIVGVVSSSKKKSMKLYMKQETYDLWLFYYGQDPDRLPEIVYYGQEKKD